MEIKKNDIGKSAQFWDGVAQIYEGAEMTNHDSDNELKFVFDILNNVGGVENMTCFGVADGSRDPHKLLSFMRENDIPLPKNMILNDLSPNLLNVCKRRMVNWEIPTFYHDGPMDQMNNWFPKKFRKKVTNPWYVIGVYNTKFISESLAIYRENKNIIGNIFTITPLLLSDDFVQGRVAFSFHINNFEEYIERINNFSKEINFVGYSIKTDTGFITHYYTTDGINAFVKGIFRDCKVETFETASRYTITLIKQSNKKPDCLVTTLNNVIGNIPYDMQSTSMRKIYENLFM